MLSNSLPIRLRVVILEDDAALAHAMQDVIELRGHAVSLAHELRTAWQAILATIPDVFVADFWVGEKQSTELLIAVRLSFVAVRCVLVSGSQPSEWRELVSAGIVERVLRKPFQPDELVALIEG